MFDVCSVRSSCRAARLSAIAFASFVAVALVTSLQVRADVTWTLPAGQAGDWSAASNWGGAVPTIFDIAYVSNGGTVNVTQLGEICYTLSLGSSAGNGTIQMTGGSLSAYLYEYVGDSGMGSFTQSGGTNGGANFGVYLGNNAGSSGGYSLSGTGLLSSWTQIVGYSGDGTFTQTGGTNSGAFLTLGNNIGSTGTYNLSGNGQ